MPPPALPLPQILQKICWYIVLSPIYSTSQGSSGDAATLLASTLADKQLGDLPTYKALLQTMVNQEIIPWGQFQAQYTDEVKAQPGVFGGEDAAKRAADLKLRVIEHNLQVGSFGCGRCACMSACAMATPAWTCTVN
jgi:26S proteasome regulatory subunit N5